MGAIVPDDDTQKRRHIDGLCNPGAQKYVSLQWLVDLANTKQEAQNWEKVKLIQ